MNHLRARDLMTPDVITLPPETPVITIARLLADRGISAVPVVDATGTLRGIVTEADLIRRLAGEVERPASWLVSLFSNQARDADRYARTHGVTAGDIMTEGAITVDPDTLAGEIAQLMETRHIRRVLVVQDGRLRGLVSRADLLRALVAPTQEGGALSDDRIRRAVLAAMKREPWTDTFYTLVDVQDGVVEFHGFSRSNAVQRGLRVLAENVPGVKGVKDSTQPMPTSLYAAA
ncbi:MAG TPA: CBS domain-containing protein [Acetobacteraceae bacterium]|nr:CBS domain-containing protein [Acetobacteraceae bacterium]